MPTPDDDAVHSPFIPPSHIDHRSHTTCPPDVRDNRSEYGHYAMDTSNRASPGPAARQPQDPSSSEPEPSPHAHLINDATTLPKMPGALTLDDHDDYLSSSSGEISESASHDSMDTVRPQNEEESRQEEEHCPSSKPLQEEYENLPPPSDIHRLPRMIPLLTSSFLRPFSKFRGQQQSDKQVYQVEVELKYVDMAESSLCGFLKIEGKHPHHQIHPSTLLTISPVGLTADHPTLTTFFEGEIIGPKYTFQTRHPSWGATDKTDMQHWARFPAWRPLAKQAKKPDFHFKNPTQRENIFMRWKESFLVPDHRVREISGASFEGFYYICFNQVSGDINGIYFHAKSEKFQQLELKHVPDWGCYPAMEFR